MAASLQAFGRVARAHAFADALARGNHHPAHQLAKTLIWDLGHEMAQHQRFTVATGVQVYFCVDGPSSSRHHHKH